MVRRPGRGARSHVGCGSAASGALAADVFIGRLADFALCEGSHRSWDAIGNPMDDTGSSSAFRIDHSNREALCSGRRTGPRQGRRNVFTNTVRITWCIVGVFLWHRGAVLESRGCQHDGLCCICDLRYTPRRENYSANQQETFTFTFLMKHSVFLLKVS